MHWLGGLLLLCLFGISAADDRPPGAAIASAHPLATAAGHEILERGGNAFDAAIAVTATLAVVEPMGSGLGGGGFWLLHRASDDFQVMLDGRERAPLAATRDMYLDAHGKPVPGLSLNGALAAAIPGEPAAIAHLAQFYGRLPLAVSLRPAIRAAEQGFKVYPRYLKLLRMRQGQLSDAAQHIFLTADKQLPAVGSVIRQPQLAGTLRRLAEGGHAGFYQGQTARLLLQAVTANGGIWSRQDLDSYQVVERQPVTGNYRGARVTSAALPSSGGIVLLQMLNILQGFDLPALDEAARLQKIIEAMRLAYRDRARYLGDSDFVEVDQQRLLSNNYATELRRQISDQAGQSEPLLQQTTTGEDTSHFSIIDSEGNRVAATLSINYPFGSGFMADGSGVILNNEMDDFAIAVGEPNVYGLVGAEANAIVAGKRPLSSMTPTFVDDERGILVIGTPGGSRIISMVLLAIIEYLDMQQDVSAIVARPRFHHQYLPDVVQHEPDAIADTLRTELQLMGYILQPRSDVYGNMQAVVFDRVAGSLQAASDPRWAGAAVVRPAPVTSKSQD
jgi:gamma-glutamyltranspeptidase/glutathione hydrolase